MILILLFVDSGNAVGDAADKFIGDRSGKTGKLFRTYLTAALLPDQDNLIPYPDSAYVADIYHRLVHCDFADDMGAPAVN